MRSKCFKAFLVALLLLGAAGQPARAGMVIRYFYDNITGTAVNDLLNATNAAGVKIFPDGPNKDGSPLQTEVESQYFEGAAVVGDGANNYGSMMRGYLEAPVTGNYTFYIASDDASDLYLSTDTSEANKTRVAYVSGYTGARAYTANASQKSAVISLVKGQKYYIQAIHKEGTGGDNVSVGWQMPGSTTIDPLPVRYVQPYPIVKVANPSFIDDLSDMAVEENTVVVFAPSLNASQPVNYQWVRDSLPIPGEILSSYSIKAKVSDSGSKFYLLAGAFGGVLQSKVVTLTVTNDLTPAYHNFRQC